MLLGRWTCRAASSLVFLLTIRRWWRPSWLGRVANGRRVAGPTGIGAVKEGAVVVVVDEVWVRTAVGIEA